MSRCVGCDRGDLFGLQWASACVDSGGPLVKRSKGALDRASRAVVAAVLHHTGLVRACVCVRACLAGWLFLRSMWHTLTRRVVMRRWKWRSGQPLFCATRQLRRCWCAFSTLCSRDSWRIYFVGARVLQVGVEGAQPVKFLLAAWDAGTKMKTWGCKDAAKVRAELLSSLRAIGCGGG